MLACFVFGPQGWWLLFTIFPILLTPLPFVLTKLCSSDDNVFAEKPRGKHWSLFMTSFFYMGCWAIPILLVLVSQIKVESMLLSLGGTLIVTLLNMWLGPVLYGVELGSAVCCSGCHSTRVEE